MQVKKAQGAKAKAEMEAKAGEVAKEIDNGLAEPLIAEPLISAFLMSQHWRLGADCTVPVLDDKVLRMCTWQEQGGGSSQTSSMADLSSSRKNERTKARIIKELLAKNFGAPSSMEVSLKGTTVADILLKCPSAEAAGRAIERLSEPNIAKALKTYQLFFVVHILAPASRQSEFAVAEIPTVVLLPTSANAAAMVLQAMCRRVADRYIFVDKNPYLQELLERERLAREERARARHEQSLVFCKVSEAVLTVGEHQNRPEDSSKVGDRRSSPSRLESMLFGGPRNVEHVKFLKDGGSSEPGYQGRLPAMPQPALSALLEESDSMPTLRRGLDPDSSSADGHVSDDHGPVGALVLQQNFREPTPRLSNGAAAPQKPPSTRMQATLNL